MSDTIAVTPEALRQLAERFDAIRSALEQAETALDDDGALRSGAIAGALDDFSKAWTDKRRELVYDLNDMSSFLHGVAQQMEDADRGLSCSLFGGSDSGSGRDGHSGSVGGGSVSQSSGPALALLGNARELVRDPPRKGRTAASLSNGVLETYADDCKPFVNNIIRHVTGGRFQPGGGYDYSYGNGLSSDFVMRRVTNLADTRHAELKTWDRFARGQYTPGAPRTVYAGVRATW